MKAIELRKISFAYVAGQPILKEVDLTADYGELILLSGHSGEGKSTLMYVLSGIIPNLQNGLLSGEVLIDGESIKGKKLGEVCRKVGVVLQNADEQIVHSLVEDEIAFGGENLSFPPELIQKQVKLVCELLSLDPKDHCRTLSGGQKQRLVTASILAMGPKILILDEPLANLDQKGADRLMETLRLLAKGGYCVLLIEHRLDRVLPFVDQVYDLSGGRLTLIEDKAAYLSSQSLRIEDDAAPYVPAKPLFELKGVRFGYRKGEEILKGVDLTVDKGSRTLILGENGAGKSTLFRLLARLAKPSSGQITQYLDPAFKQNKRGSRKWFRKVGVVYQNPDYQLFMPTVAQEVSFGAYSEDYAEYILKAFGLFELKDRHPQSLSEGQKRRLSIAAVLACKPEVLLLDEPTVGQDYEGLCRLVELLNAIHFETGNTLITVTHDLRCAEALADKAVLLDDGVIKQTGGKELIREYFGLK